MKKIQFLIPMLLGLMIALNSCSVSKDAIAQRKEDIKRSKYADQACFVQFNDGTVKNYGSLKLVTGVFKVPYLLADGKTKIEANKITAYQTKDYYAVSQKLFTSGRHSYIAVEALPGFAIRIAKGKLNVYVKKYMNGSKVVDEYYLQEGDNGPIFAYTQESLDDLVKTNPEAVSYFYNRKYNTKLPKKQQVTASYSNNSSLVYRHTSMITKN